MPNVIRTNFWKATRVLRLARLAGLAAICAGALLAQPAPGDRVSVLVHLEEGANRGPVRAFAANSGGAVRYEYGILPNVMNLREIPSGMLNALRNIPGVARVEEDAVAYEYLIQSVPRIKATPSDLSSFQVGGKTVDGSGVRVCILDGGIDAAHPVFSGRIDAAADWDFANNDSNPADDTGHGTHVAATAAGLGGVAPGATIVAIKVLNNGSGNFSDVIAGMDYCAGTGPRGDGKFITDVSERGDIINMSLGGGQFSSTCDSDSAAAAANNAVNAGLSVIAASGNNGYSNAMGTPACGSKVISVGATYDANYSKSFSWCLATNKFRCTSSCTDSNPAADQIGCFSNKSDFLDVAAPGCEITAAAIGGGTSVKCGTSMAAPHTAGLAALLLHMNPTLPPVDPGNGSQNVRACVQGGSVDVNGGGFDRSYGHGRINAFGSLSLCGVAGPQPPSANAGPDQQVSDGDGNGFESVTLSGTGSDPDGGAVSFEWKIGMTILGSSAQITHNFPTGVHDVVLTVEDEDGETATDQVTVTVLANQAPTANAGPDQTVTDGEPVQLDGSGSSDPDGTIVSYAWSEGGNSIASGVQPTVTLGLGDHTLTLVVTDNGGASKSDTVLIRVVAPSAVSTMSVASLVGSGTNQGSTWTAFVAATVLNNNGSPVAGVLVSGSFSAGASRNVSCTTNGSGQCTVSNGGGVRKNVGSVGFSVTNVSGGSLTYAPGVTSTNVSKP